jgi:hypothetical protein
MEDYRGKKVAVAPIILDIQHYGTSTAPGVFSI